MAAFHLFACVVSDNYVSWIYMTWSVVHSYHIRRSVYIHRCRDICKTFKYVRLGWSSDVASRWVHPTATLSLPSELGAGTVRSSNYIQLTSAVMVPLVIDLPCYLLSPSISKLKRAEVERSPDIYLCDKEEKMLYHWSGNEASCATVSLDGTVDFDLLQLLHWKT